MSVYAEYISMLLRMMNQDVYYIRIAEEDKINRANNLKKNKIMQLPVSALKEIEDVSECDNGPELNQRFNFEGALEKILCAQAPLYSNIEDITNKLKLSAKTSLQYSDTCRVNMWCRDNRNVHHVLIVNSIKGLYYPFREINLSIIYFPNLGFVWRRGRDVISKILNTLIGSENRKIDERLDCKIDDTQLKVNSKVAYVVHDGLWHGSVFKKEQYYSSNNKSPLSKNNIIHLSYRGKPLQTDGMDWGVLSVGRGREIVYNFIRSVFRSLIHIRNIKDIILVVFLADFFSKYKAYCSSISGYPSLKIALIDYDVLCPKALLLAFESGEIKTVAFQERFLMAFYRYYGTILNTYFIASSFIGEAMENSDTYIVEEYIPLGQYRSDYLYDFKKRGVPPDILVDAFNKNKKIIIAFGFHSHIENEVQIVDPLLNWEASKEFISDMIRLSTERDEFFIVLRYKDLDWLDVPYFNDVVGKIKDSENIIISDEYDINYFSYYLSAYSDLVIAKHSSIADECLAWGVPVLFYDYLHNTKEIVSSTFDYGGSPIMCRSYSELLDMAKEVLDGKGFMDYTVIKKKYYNTISEGGIKSKAHQIIESMLD